MDEAALAAAQAEQDPFSLAAGERLRKLFGPETARWALQQVSLRRKAVAKCPRAAEMLFTSSGLEQATRASVATWRAKQFIAGGVRRVWDLGCGIGADSMAFAAAGLEVIAVEADPDTARVAEHNISLAGTSVVYCRRAEECLVPEADGVFLDPARRTSKGRSWRLGDCTPSWDFVLSYLRSQRFVAVKLGPGIAKEVLPKNCGWVWVSAGGDLVELSLWNREIGSKAVLITDRVHEVVATGGQIQLGPLGDYLLEPDGAALRAGAVADIVGNRAWQLDPQVGYLSADSPIPSPWLTNFEVVEVLPYDKKVLRSYVRRQRIGSVEIKKRSFDVDPAVLRRELKPKGDNQATIILTHTLAGARAVVVRRIGTQVE